MINIHQTVNVQEYTDAELVSRSLAGDREAFSRIVARYQILICSLAYSRIGHLGQSEDVAQETFITAWKRLRLLREPSKLRAWLCGIVNYRILKTLRREGREPSQMAEPLDAALDTPAAVPLPSDQTVSREEEAILWRSLERIPELYREPLVLYYRQHESIEAVANQLDLSEDAVKQRLSRGRKLLHEEVTAFVENTLRKTAPGHIFSSLVLAALPAAPAASASAAILSKGAAATKSGMVTIWLAALAPFIGIILGVVAQLVAIRSAMPPGRERRARSFGVILIWACVIGFAWGGETAVNTLGRHFEWSDWMFFGAKAFFWWVYTVGLVTWFTRMARRDNAAIQQCETTGNVARLGVGVMAGLTVGMHLAMFSWLVMLAWKAHDTAAAGTVTGMAIGMAAWNLFRLRNLSGTEAAKVNCLHYAFCCLLILGVVNLRMDVWLAYHYGLSLAEIHRQLPLWLIPVLTLALLGWMGLLLAAGKKSAPSENG